MCQRKIQKSWSYLFAVIWKFLAYLLKSAFMLKSVNKNQNKHGDLQDWRKRPCVYYKA